MFKIISFVESRFFIIPMSLIFIGLVVYIKKLIPNYKDVLYAGLFFLAVVFFAHAIRHPFLRKGRAFIPFLFLYYKFKEEVWCYMDNDNIIIASRIQEGNKKNNIISIWPDRQSALLCSGEYKGRIPSQFTVVDFFCSVLRNFKFMPIDEISFYQNHENGTFEAVYSVKDVYRDSGILKKIFGEFIAKNVFEEIRKRPPLSKNGNTGTPYGLS